MMRNKGAGKKGSTLKRSVKNRNNNTGLTTTMSYICGVLTVAVLLITVLVYGVLPPIVSSYNGNKKDRSSLTTNATSDPLVVDTQYGQVRGTERGGVRIFHGVRYAKAPIGDLRWKSPVAPDPWSPDIMDATRIPPGCPQECNFPIYCSKDSSEDCLFLEIYAPSNISSPVPVMLYLHGGSFKDVTSTLAIFNATILVQRSSIVVVLVEFRIGALGFLVTGQGEGQATGNYGIQDQLQALLWVNANIRSFGGDPDKVTFAGQSSGAQSIFIHLLSPVSSQYFRSAIVESAPLTLPYKTSEEARALGKTFYENLKCADKNNSLAVNMTCLRGKSTSEIIEAQIMSSGTGMSVADKIEPWGPSVDGELVKSQAMAALQEYSESSQQIKPIICSYTKDEGFGFVRDIFKEPVPPMMYTLLANFALKQVPEGFEELYPLVDKEDTREQISSILRDLVFLCPLKHVINLLTKSGNGQKVWLYTWASEMVTKLPPEYSICQNRACHSTEVPFVFQSFDGISNHTSDNDIQSSNTLIDYYTKFMYFGNPNGGTYQTENNNSYSRQPRAHGGEQASLVDWPSVNNGELDGITRLVFSNGGQVKVIGDHTDEKCDAWDKTGYSSIN